ncbi:MAG TPA: pirin family protein [Chitinophagaceae bacterium]|jgi:hypothetical protein|nr:pirin family protein [Chitinophagaceae bacterium]
MEPRTVRQKSGGEALKVGPLSVRQPLPAAGLEDTSPFLLLHHAGPQLFTAGQQAQRLSPHPHRGFEPVTFLFSGGLHHRDSLGNEGYLEAGDVQWMTAGRGIIHSEGPSEALQQQGGVLELVQLWVNLPRAHKGAAPAYQDIKADSIPAIELAEGMVTVRVVAGTVLDQTGPARTFTPLTAMTVRFEAGARWQLPVPAEHTALAYLLNGELETGGTKVNPQELVLYAAAGDTLTFESTTAGRLLLLTGLPIREPVVSYGPFVLNYPGEIKQAVLDYETGKMGALDF